jgi:alkylation response protein AidB-like acyl-CoA dehydrogenase
VCDDGEAMDWTEPPEAAAFRGEVRAWLDDHLEPRFRGLTFEMEAGPEWLGLMKEWNARIADAGYATIAWPVDYGGRGAGLLEQVVLAEELDRAQAPPTLNPLGISNIAPAILQFGTEDQKRRFLPPMARGDEIWCQGFSEPDAGSDLAALATAAAREGDHYVLNGQKVWSTLGHVADWCELLVRTDPTAPRHRGITCLLVDMRTPGIEVRPLTTITGQAEFAEIFFTDARVPLSARLGDENAGWTVAMTTLMNERGGVASLHLGVRRRIRALLEEARAAGRLDDPGVRRRGARLYLQGECLKLLADRSVSGALHDRPFGPESSLAKLVWSDTEQDLTELAAELFGMDAMGGLWGRARLHARSFSIVGGTTQVNKNVIATRILDLPRG